MTKTLLIFLSFVLTISACRNQQEKTIKHIYNPCLDGHDTTFHISFSKDTTTKDFYELIEFIESSTGFKRTGVYKQDSVVLQKRICFEKDDSPIEFNTLDNVRQNECWFKLTKSEKGYKNYYPNFGLIQINFLTQTEKDKAQKLIDTIGWGSPIVKWNSHCIVSGKTRVYLIIIADATFQDYCEKFADLIEKKWIDKNSHQH